MPTHTCKSSVKGSPHQSRTQAGLLRDPCTGAALRFDGASGAVGIDPAVSREDAWAAGARTWPAERRARFAQDPLNQLTVSAAAAARAGADAARWLPPDPDFQCAYVARQIAVKAKWGLRITPQAKWGLRITPQKQRVMALALSRCPGQDVPTGVLPESVDHVRPVGRSVSHPAAV
jgi:hypothetical protein